MVAGVTEPENLAVVPVHALALSGALIATVGSWSPAPGGAFFTPLFPPVPGTVHAVVAVTGERWTELTRAAVPTVELVPSTRVASIDPGADRVPANLLRISVNFSAPMEEGSAAGHLRLRGEDGTELEGALVPMPPELWDRPRRRLTVLIEPGRIKRGLQPNLQAGPPLIAGTSVTFVVDGRLRDADGACLVSHADRTYRVVDPIRSRVDPTLWDVQWPDSAGGPLVVRFGRSLDRALVRRCLTIVGADGRAVPGRADLDREALKWTFNSAVPADGAWSLHVHPDLEDLAGNSVRRMFDRDLEEQQDEKVSTSSVVLRQDA